jgi:hypothetical protein
MLVSKRQTNLVKRFLMLMIKSDQTGHLYHSTIDNQLHRLLLMGIDLKPYLDSAMAYYQIENAPSGYPDYHPNRHMMVVPCDLPSLHDIERSYD